MPNEEDDYDTNDFNEGEEPNSKDLKREPYSIESMTNGMTGGSV